MSEMSHCSRGATRPLAAAGGRAQGGSLAHMRRVWWGLFTNTVGFIYKRIRVHSSALHAFSTETAAFSVYSDGCIHVFVAFMCICKAGLGVFNDACIHSVFTLCIQAYSHVVCIHNFDVFNRIQHVAYSRTTVFSCICPPAPGNECRACVNTTRSEYTVTYACSMHVNTFECISSSNAVM